MLLIKLLGNINARLVSLDLLEVGVLSLSTQTMGLGPETISSPSPGVAASRIDFWYLEKVVLGIKSVHFVLHLDL